MKDSEQPVMLQERTDSRLIRPGNAFKGKGSFIGSDGIHQWSDLFGADGMRGTNADALIRYRDNET